MSDLMNKNSAKGIQNVNTLLAENDEFLLDNGGNGAKGHGESVTLSVKDDEFLLNNGENGSKGILNQNTLCMENKDFSSENSKKGVSGARTPSVKSVQTWAFGDMLIRTIQLENAPWFIGKDIATALDYKPVTNLTRYLDPDETAMCTVPTSGGVQEMLVVNEPGLYHAIFMSRKETAKSFRRWVTGEVLPSLRKSGAYAVGIDAELEQEKKLMEIARLRANRYILEHLEEYTGKNLLTPRAVENITGVKASVTRKEGNNAYRADFDSDMAAWLKARLAPSEDAFVTLKACYADFIEYTGRSAVTVTQSFFTRRLCSSTAGISVTQKKIDGEVVQVIVGYELTAGE
jgi:prophage antirepressor-like protein